MTSIHIEICKSYKPKAFNLRIGDISGSSESIGVFKEDVLKEISDGIDNLSQENINVNLSSVQNRTMF